MQFKELIGQSIESGERLKAEHGDVGPWLVAQGIEDGEKVNAMPHAEVFVAGMLAGQVLAGLNGEAGDE